MRRTTSLPLLLVSVFAPPACGDGTGSSTGTAADSDGTTSAETSTGDGDDTTGDGDGTAGDGDGDGTGNGDGIVYIADPLGLFTLDLATGDSAQLGDVLPRYDDDRLVVSPDGTRIFLEDFDGPRVLDTATGSGQLTETLFTDGVLGWVDADSIFNSEVLRMSIRSYAGILEAEYSPQSGGYASRWFLSPDGTKFAITEAGTGRLKTFPVSGSVDFLDDITLTQDCAAPTWLGNGTMVGVCINTQEFYSAVEGATDATRVPLDEPEYDVRGSTIWSGNDRILVHLAANGTGGAVGHKFVVLDSTGAQVETVDWLASAGGAGLLIRNIRLSKDDSSVIWSDQGPELWRADRDGSNQEEFDPGSQLVLEFDWSNGK